MRIILVPPVLHNIQYVVSSMLIILWDRWNIKMPTIVSGSIAILSDAGLGMAMFSLGMKFFLVMLEKRI